MTSLRQFRWSSDDNGALRRLFGGPLARPSLIRHSRASRRAGQASGDALPELGSNRGDCVHYKELGGKMEIPGRIGFVAEFFQISAAQTLSSHKEA